MITFKKDIIALALTGALIGGANFTANAQSVKADATTQTQKTVTTAELTKFADAFQKVQAENQVAQQQMMSVIEEKGLDVKRFNEIQKSKMNPEAEVVATEEELKMHTEVLTELEKMRPQLEAKMEAIIKENGLTMDRYKAVAVALQNDKELQQKFQGIMMKNQTEG